MRFAEALGRARSVRRLAHLALGAMIVGCGSNGSGATHCPAATQASPIRVAIYRGAAVATYMALDDATTAAIARVDLGPEDAGSEVCTGFFVHPQWVLTAGHCAVGGQTTGTVHAVVAGMATDVAVERVVVDDSADAALIEVAPAIPAIAFLALFQGDPGEFIGARAQAAGFGLTDLGPTATVRFAVDTVAAVGAMVIQTAALSGSGACAGDSGGPLIVRDDRGIPVAIGVLSTGSAGCAGPDQYVRVDVLAPWVTQVVGELPAPTGGCGGITPEGRCFSGTSVWCDDRGQLVGERCGGESPCGWSREQMGYRCVSADPCDGVDSLGTCGGPTTLKTCNRGQLEATDCSCSGDVCAVSGADGAGRCQPPVPAP